MTSSSEYLTKAQIIKIAPLFIPYFVFQFTPFLYFGTLLLVMNEIYSNNELISFKALGLSYKKLLKVFFIITLIVELFVFLIINLYPITTKSFYKQKVSFATDNIFKNLKKDSFSKIGKYTIYFRTINKNNELERVTIFKLDDKKKNIKDDVTLNDDLTVKEKIEKLFNRNGYVFNVLVEIVTSKKIYHTKIAGKVNNHLITLDNDIICINDIRDIIVKD